MRIKRATKLAMEHWKYIEELLHSHKESEETIDKIKFHYIEAFIHGYKHAKEKK